MNLEAFKNDVLQRELDGLSELHRIAFAASCCERLFPFYTTFSEIEQWGDPRVPRKALDTIWSIVEGKGIDIDELKTLREQCCSEGICPGEDDNFGSSSLFIEAGNSIYSICLILDAYPEVTVSTAVDVSNYVEETLEYYIDDCDNSFQEQCKEYTLEEKIEIFQSHFLVLKEIAKETEDLQKLKEAKILTLDFLEWLRTSSQKEGQDFINFLHESRSERDSTQ
jgi:uncharacterized protein